MIRINSLKTPTEPGGFVVDEMRAPTSQIPLAVPVEFPVFRKRSPSLDFSFDFKTKKI